MLHNHKKFLSTYKSIDVFNLFRFREIVPMNWTVDMKSALLEYVLYYRWGPRFVYIFALCTEIIFIFQTVCSHEGASGALCSPSAANKTFGLFKRRFNSVGKLQEYYSASNYSKKFAENPQHVIKACFPPQFGWNNKCKGRR